ncbi:hypothetical protein [Streptomyces sp. ALI-76-A]|uniref:hypothetical protein n=1 Tax=Streptomyces sp. ALI-76-A TaxID=3025736 RepID=UPI00256F4517|nr:hypothetical protein [Streptomyces sp. ALI-76-A]MDL5204969.1 hypothetical protein [Streptomyces sp. ALI-76-A]
MAQVTSSDRAYRFFFAEDIQSETFTLSEGVERTPELDQVAMDYLKAKLALFAAVNPGRIFPDRNLYFSGTLTVSEVTSESVRLYPFD